MRRSKLVIPMSLSTQKRGVQGEDRKRGVVAGNGVGCHESPVFLEIEREIVSTDTTYLFRGEQVGDYFVNFKIDAENGSVEKQVKVSVLDKLPPEVTLDDAAVVMSGRDRSFGPKCRIPRELLICGY